MQKQQYEAPQVGVCRWGEEDVLRTSGGLMTWGWSEDPWEQERKNTFIE